MLEVLPVFPIPSKTLSVDKADGWRGRTAGQTHSDESFGTTVGQCRYLSWTQSIFFNEAFKAGTRKFLKC